MRSFAVLVSALCGPLLAGAVSLRAAGGRETAFQPGTAVLLCGLKNDIEVNGHSATVLRFDTSSGRYGLRLKSGPRVQLAAANVVAAEAGCTQAATNSSEAAAASVIKRTWNSTISAAKDSDCSEACDKCFMDNLESAIDQKTTVKCFAVCKKGCQFYCDEQDTLPGCSKREEWVAHVLGEAPIPPASSAGAEHGPVCTFDSGKDSSCNRFRWCNGEGVTACPEDYLY
eukprot:TRINITY_DN115083_c0_g1_i1.p1 TRINITY_DN115083_c0_g1~~TRINITY_DN115083_c0_g1_i1.p1  ORF type:complete len:228 (+),score=44.36 TRINITY_DN115083_c0_g1_i1:137-820(+)